MSALDGHLNRNPSHGHAAGIDDGTVMRSVWDNGWVTFEDRIERALLVPPAAEAVDIAVLTESDTVEGRGDHSTTVKFPEDAGAGPGTLRHRPEGSVLRFTLDR